MAPKQSFSVVLPGYDADDGAAPRVCAAPQPPAEPVHGVDPCSAYELFLAGLSHGENRRILGWRPLPRTHGTDYVPLDVASTAPFRWHTYGEVRDVVRRMAAALIARDGFGLVKGDRVGIYAKNSPNWTIAALAISAAGLTLVTMYDTLGPHAVKYICNHAKLKIVFVSDENLPRFLEARPTIPSVQTVVVFGAEGLSELARLKDSKPLTEDGDVRKFEDVLNAWSPSDVALPKAELSTVFVVMYTSGTTGDPKGVVLTNRSLVLSCASGRAFVHHWNVPVGKDDSIYSFLPLAHIFAQQTEAGIYAVGGSIGYYQGNVKLILDDLTELKPSVFPAVPRVFARFEQKIREGVAKSSFIKRVMFEYALKSQLYALENSLPRVRIWDSLIFNKIRNQILPNARIILTGAAPMSPHTNAFLSVCFGTTILQGFGLTETLGGISAQIPGIWEGIGTCGPPLPGVQMKLVDVPEMEYLTTDKPRPRGELYVLSPVNMQCYYKDPENTAKAFPNGDDWFATGDIATWTDDGCIQIIDRRKNLFKLAQGEYVSPEKLEQEYAKAELVLQIFVYGHSLQSSLVAVVVPDILPAKLWGEAHGFGSSPSLSDLASTPAFKQAILEQLCAIRERTKFHGYETIRDIIFEVEGLNELGQGFHVGNDLLTPSFKLKRPQLAMCYGRKLDLLYESMAK
jgi:long-chain acyl-CoA synthetase